MAKESRMWLNLNSNEAVLLAVIEPMPSPASPYNPLQLICLHPDYLVTMPVKISFTGYETLKNSLLGLAVSIYKLAQNSHINTYHFNTNYTK